VRRVQFIKGLVIDERPMVGPDEIRYHAMGQVLPVPVFEAGGAEEYLLTEQTVETMVVPIHDLHGCDTVNPTYPPELYIAYSKDVQMLLKMPFDTMKRELEECRDFCTVQRHMLAEYLAAPWWRRLRYLFNRKHRP